MIWYNSLFNSFTEVSTLSITENKNVSSANNFSFDDMPPDRSVISTKTRRGPRIDP